MGATTSHSDVGRHGVEWWRRIEAVVPSESFVSRENGRFFPTERADSHVLGEVQHWISVYRDLRDLCIRLLAESQSENLLLRAHLDQFQRRLDFWNERVQSLGDSDARDESV
jgi:hypothetical protein